MPKRTRSFESLEERRLLTGWTTATAAPAGAMSQAVGEPVIVAARAGESASVSSSSQAASATDSKDADSAESPNEYLSAIVNELAGAPTLTASDNAATLAAIDNVYFAPESSGTSPYYSGSSYAPSKTYTTTSTDPVPTGPATLAAMAPPIQPLQGKTLATEAQPMASSPAAANLPNIARSGLGGFEAGPDDMMEPAGIAGTPADLPPPGTTAPVAMMPSALTSEFDLAERATDAVIHGRPAGAVRDGAFEGYFTKSPWLAGLMPGAANADLPSIEQAVDHLCERIERWGEELFRDAGEWRLSESLVLAAAAAAALEYVRAQFRETGSTPFAESTREPWQPRLRTSFGQLAQRGRRIFGQNP